MKPNSLTTLMVRLALAAVLGTAAATSFAERARLVPPPANEETAPASAGSETIVLAGGCFWGVQGVFQHVKGVTSAVSGYTGGSQSKAQYERVSTGTTGHAESVKVTFDPRQVSLGRILQIYFSVAHDPTQLNRQGPDSGTQYRSEIVAQTAQQAAVARSYIEQLNASHVFESAVVTRLETDKPFFPAEGYHQDYMTRNPMNPYIMINDRPKVTSLKQLFPELYRADPVLVAAAR